MCNHAVAMEITRTLALDAPADDVWRFLADPDELAAWVGEEVRSAPVTSDGDHRRLTWTWAPDGVTSEVEVEVVEVGDRTEVHVVERTAGQASSSARACSRRRWDDALFALEWRAVTWTHRLVGV
jgi:uncharacterized protein YndB with AHSA1/START domain